MLHVVATVTFSTILTDQIAPVLDLNPLMVPHHTEDKLRSCCALYKALSLAAVHLSFLLFPSLLLF
jgi:hypothetical protein